MGGIEGLLGLFLEEIAQALNLSAHYYGRLVHQGAEAAFILGALISIFIPIYYFLYLSKKLRYVAGTQEAL